jgi:hypothetical protein
LKRQERQGRQDRFARREPSNSAARSAAKKQPVLSVGPIRLLGVLGALGVLGVAFSYAIALAPDGGWSREHEGHEGHEEREEDKKPIGRHGYEHWCGAKRRKTKFVSRARWIRSFVIFVSFVVFVSKIRSRSSQRRP